MTVGSTYERIPLLGPQKLNENGIQDDRVHPGIDLLRQVHFGAGLIEPNRRPLRQPEIEQRSRRGTACGTKRPDGFPPRLWRH